MTTVSMNLADVKATLRVLYNVVPPKDPRDTRWFIKLTEGMEDAYRIAMHDPLMSEDAIVHAITHDQE